MRMSEGDVANGEDVLGFSMLALQRELIFGLTSAFDQVLEE